MVSANPRFHKSEERFREQGEKVIKSAMDQGRITRRDEELLRIFISELRATAGISNSRASKIIGLLVGARRWIGPFAEVDTGQLYLAVDAINSFPEFTRNTKGDVLRSLKRLFLWMNDSGYAAPGLQVEKVRRVKPPTYQPKEIVPDDLLTEDEILRLIKAATNSRDRALVSMLYEGGFRIGEIGELRWKQVSFNDWNVSVETSFKTGKRRHVPLTMSRSYLQSWCNDYPGDQSPDGFVFLTRQGRPLQYQGVVKMLRNLCQSAGIVKHCHPHLFRHSRVTDLIKKGYNDSIIKRMLWGGVETDMYKVYCHLADHDVDDEIAVKMGIRKRGRPTDESKALEPLQCPRCYTVNGPTARFCDQCGAALTTEAADDVNLLTARLVELVSSPEGDELRAALAASQAYKKS